MQAFTEHSGGAVPLWRSNVDTDQIIPSAWLKRVERTGFGEGLFAAWRQDGSFILDDPRFVGASILLAGPDFGIGSSREHAVWALQDWGFRVVISERFGDIFRNNALKSGLLPVELPAAAVESLMQQTVAEPATVVTVDLRERIVRAGAISESFAIDEHSRWRLLHGYDDVSLTLQHQDDIEAYEGLRSPRLPVTRMQ